MNTDTTSRRAFLGAVAGTAAGTALTGRAGAAESTDLSEWFSNTDNATRVVDERGSDSVTVEVGASGNAGNLAYGPAVIRIDPGTTVTWTWVNGYHNVVATDESFESPFNSGSGTFEHTFEETGITKYYCTPHRGSGMKGAVIVGDAEVSLSAGSGGGSTTAASQETVTMGGGDEPLRTFGGWLEETENYNGVVDRTGQDEVEVTVGASGNGENQAFDPPAIHVDPGTTVNWTWADGDTNHDVKAVDGQFHSENVASNHRYSVEFTGDGVAKYECESHTDNGMRGVVLVGAGPGQRLTPLGWAGVAGVIGLTTAALGKTLKMHLEESTGPEPPNS